MALSTGPGVPAMAPIETVAIVPRFSVRVVRVAILFALGGALGVGVELLAHIDASGPRLEPAAQLPSRIEATPPEIAAPASLVAPVDVLEDKTPVVPPPHHHHVHHATVPLAATSAPSDVDAGGEGDDVAAAVQALTKAKEEVSLP